MTDKNIIKALEICSGAENICKNCYLLNYSMDYNACMAKLMTDAKDLITRQQAEIDSLKIFRGYAKKRASDYRTMRDKYLNAKSEAVKEFAEKLKEKYGIAECIVTVDSADIDNLVKENGGENNGST